MSLKKQTKNYFNQTKTSPTISTISMVHKILGPFQNLEKRSLKFEKYQKQEQYQETIKV